MSGLVNNLYEFDEFRLDVQRRALLRRQDLVALTPKAFDTLVVLVQNGGQLMTKDELMKAVWPDTFVEESNLTQTVFLLRKALEEAGGCQRYIVTIPGQGYRFVANVKEVSGNGHPVAAAPGASQHSIVLPTPEKSSPRGWPSLFIIAVVLVAALAAWFKWSRTPTPRPPNGRMMLAVLPFENLTGDAGQDYFSDGMTEEMITQMGNLDPQHLGVIARTSVMHYKNSRQQLEQIGRELGVQYVLEGSVRRDSNKVRVTAQLIQMKDQTHLWARQYDRDLSNLLALQGEIAQEIANEIQLALDDHKRVDGARQPSLSPNAIEAYDLYLKGRYFWNKRTAQGFQQAIECFQQAIAKDPTYARAYAGLADSYAMIGIYSLAPQNEFIPKARAAALKALELDEELAEAHTSLALITENYDWDWPTAEKEYRRAIQLDPNYATAHQWYAECLAFQGRFDEALAESERARALDPLSLIIAADKGAILYFSRQYDRAIAQFRAVLEMEPNLQRAHMVLFAYAQKGQTVDALAEIRNWRRGDDTPWTWATEAYVYGHSGQQAQARDALKKLERVNRHQHLDPAPMLVLAYAGMNNKDEALGWLEKAYSEHSNAVTTLKVDPIYDSLRSDPRFQDLVRRVGLTQ
jgi:TolB-like protein/DNA-binding winged helix-turn-helix (wHTH) protein/Tfp pilus assembly protein PilF